MTIKSYVYKITNKINQKVYIGKSNNPEVRWKIHLYTVNHSEKKHGFSYIHAAIRKYGIENFIFEIIGDYSSEEDALSAEIKYIKEHNSRDREIGYNLTNGGEGQAGRIQSKEEREKRSAVMIARNNRGTNNKNYGKKLSEEHKKKISEGNAGKILSQETRLNISISKMGKANGMYGKIESLESRKKRGKKISKTKKESKSQPIIISIETKERLKKATLEKASQKLTDEQKDLIINYYNSEKYIKRTLASIFNVEEKTIQYVIRYWEQIKINKAKKLTTNQKESIINLYNKSLYTKKQISKMTNIPFNKIESVIKMYNKSKNISQINQTTSVSQGHSHTIVNGEIREALSHSHKIILP